MNSEVNNFPIVFPLAQLCHLWSLHGWASYDLRSSLASPKGSDINLMDDLSMEVFQYLAFKNSDKAVQQWKIINLQIFIWVNEMVNCYRLKQHFFLEDSTAMMRSEAKEKPKPEPQGISG